MLTRSLLCHSLAKVGFMVVSQVMLMFYLSTINLLSVSASTSSSSRHGSNVFLSMILECQRRKCFLQVVLNMLIHKLSQDIRATVAYLCKCKHLLRSQVQKYLLSYFLRMCIPISPTPSIILSHPLKPAQGDRSLAHRALWQSCRVSL